ncbi:hypothetical protein ACJX0J_012565, partial [Zea mays]
PFFLIVYIIKFQRIDVLFIPSNVVFFIDLQFFAKNFIASLFVGDQKSPEVVAAQFFLFDSYPQEFGCFFPCLIHSFANLSGPINPSKKEDGQHFPQSLCADEVNGGSSCLIDGSMGALLSTSLEAQFKWDLFFQLFTTSLAVTEDDSLEEWKEQQNGINS